MNNDLNDQIVKQRVLSQNSTFKTAFSATLGFYAARSLINLVGLSVFATVIFVLYNIFK